MSETLIGSVAISLETGCGHAECSEFALPLYKQLSEGPYDVCSVMPILPVGNWQEEHRTARKRAARAIRRGYEFRVIDRHGYDDDIHAINTSAPMRQGKPMTPAYLQKTVHQPLPDYPCPRHGIHTYGVVAANGHLVAYLWLYRSGELALVSQILGHADHLENEVMYLLFQGMVEHEAADANGFVVYNRHDSGTDGLRFFKERVGLTETQVRWLP